VTAGPNWYDVLDVDPAASTGEIRDAWRAAIADLTPADRRFRLYNEAAEVLLDDERRAAYDATLEPEPEPEPVSQPEPEPQPTPEPRPEPQPAPPVASPVAPARRDVPTWLLAGLAVLTALAVGLAGYLWFLQPAPDAVEDATAAARSAAEKAVVPVLSYDYQDLEGSREAAEDYLTPDYLEEYERLYDGLVESNAGSTQTVVQASFVASAVVRGGEERAEILVFVDQSTTNAQDKQPVVYRNQVRMRMENVDGRWLVDCMITQPGGECAS
jgi:Mce-associated membrane protein